MPSAVNPFLPCQERERACIGVLAQLRAPCRMLTARAARAGLLAATWPEIYHDYVEKTGKIKIDHEIAIDTLRRYSCPDSPGWHMRVPDLIRADAFLKEFRECEASVVEHEQQYRQVFVKLEVDWPERLTPGIRQRLDKPTPNDLNAWLAELE